MFHANGLAACKESLGDVNVSLIILRRRCIMPEHDLSRWSRVRNLGCTI
jgi:hypothetical protein